MRHPRHAALAIVAVAALGTAALAPVSTPVRAELIPEQNGIDVAALLAPHGYTRVEVLRRHIDRVEAEACREGGRWRVSLALLSGRSRATERLGDCAPAGAADAAPVIAPVSAPSAASTSMPSKPAHSGVLPPWSEEDRAMRALERVGYTGVRVRRWGREGWRGTACRDGMLREVRLSDALAPAAPIRAMRACPEGREAPRDLTKGPPEPPIRGVADVKARLIAQGYAGVGRIEIEGGAYHAMACEGAWRYRVSVMPDGTLRGRRNLGRCDAPAAKREAPATSRDADEAARVRPDAPADAPPAG